MSKRRLNHRSRRPAPLLDSRPLPVVDQGVVVGTSHGDDGTAAQLQRHIEAENERDRQRKVTEKKEIARVRRVALAKTKRNVKHAHAVDVNFHSKSGGSEGGSSIRMTNLSIKQRALIRKIVFKMTHKRVLWGTKQNNIGSGEFKIDNPIEIFRSIDKDGSGCLDEEEFSQAQRELGLNLSSVDVRMLMNAIDVNGDGDIQLDEFLSFIKLAHNLVAMHREREKEKRIKLKREKTRKLQLKMMKKTLSTDSILSEEGAVLKVEDGARDGEGGEGSETRPRTYTEKQIPTIEQKFEDDGRFPAWLREREDFMKLMADFEIHPAHQALRRDPDARTEHEIDAIREWLSKIDFFAYFNDNKMLAYSKVAELKRHKKGDVLFKEGEFGQMLLVVYSGNLSITCRRAGLVATMKERDSIGNISRYSSKLLQASHRIQVICAEDAEVLYMSRDNFSEVAQKYIERERWELVRFLQAIDLFRAWSQSRVYRICKHLTRFHWQPGEVVMRQGAPGDSICFIRYGHLSVQRQVELVQSNRWPTGPNKGEFTEREVRKHKSFELAILKEGMYFGEEAILRKCQRTASIVAVTSAETLHLSRENFMKIIQNSGASVIKAIREKVRKNHNIRPINVLYKEFLDKQKREREIRKELRSESKYASSSAGGKGGRQGEPGNKKMSSSVSAPELKHKGKKKAVSAAEHHRTNSVKLDTIRLSPATRKATIVQSTLKRGLGTHYDLVKALEQKDRYLELRSRAGRKSFLRRVKTTADLALTVERTRKKFLPGLMKVKGKQREMQKGKGDGEKKQKKKKRKRNRNGFPSSRNRAERGEDDRWKKQNLTSASSSESSGPAKEKRISRSEQMDSQLRPLARATTQPPDMMKKFLSSINNSMARENKLAGM